MATGLDPAAEEYLSAKLGDRARAVNQDLLNALATISDARSKRYTTARNYYDGEQGTLLTDRAKSYLERSGLKYAENFCSTVVDALAERLALSGVTTDLGFEPTPEEIAAGEQPEDEFADWLWEQFDRSRGDELQSDVHQEVTQTGDAFVIVDWDDEGKRPRMTFNYADMLTPVYEDRQMVCAAKAWNSTKVSPVNPRGVAVRRLNLYWPDRVEKWFTLAKDDDSKAEWVEWMDAGDAAWPVPWVDASQQPLGIPVFHFANVRKKDAFGRPEHWGTIPQQDRLNKELLDLASVMDSQGFPQRYASGVSDTSSLTTDPGTVWSSDNPTATYGQFPAADPSGPLKAVESTLIRIATRSRTPAHLIYISSGYPSGESLKTAESGLVAKCKNRQVYHGGTWAEVMRMLSLVALSFGAAEERPPGLTVDDVRKSSINVQWRDPETRNEKEHLDSLVTMQTLGVSDDTILGMIPGIDAAAEREKKKAADNSAENAGDALLNGAINPASMMPEDMAVGMTGRNGRG